jgi:hypothetical protein
LAVKKKTNAIYGWPQNKIKLVIYGGYRTTNTKGGDTYVEEIKKA